MRVLVTGAASGIGRATFCDWPATRRRAGEGAWSPPWTSAPRRASTASSRHCASSAPTRCRCTATWRRRGPARVVDEAVRRFGGLDGWSATPASTGRAPLIDVRRRDWDRSSRSTPGPRGCWPRPRIPRSRPRAAPSWPPARCRAVTPTPISAPMARARPPSSCWCRCSPRSSRRTGSASTPCRPGWSAPA